MLTAITKREIWSENKKKRPYFETKNNPLRFFLFFFFKTGRLVTTSKDLPILRSFVNIGELHLVLSP